ncbi:hypothetical protein FRACYDRAFT_254914 [Fragilariopsis cylindrus CCMP1102]|uniref:Uncharacterized protein n=1 Tax=Fragilariopsis cylindrus CCMP1102 TaxID=635003 RepID=A0A1E7EKA1_9STRA|nr:hypothetical protein FRACYDRAFT_254914 [Fragilariopsis cylindrus CCMP1102]|eukprot:OEU06340.1 hypothetical protein FRACYDRAFT_254914 [Fragilariopsis cylindrus CCMP1102]
MIMHAFKDYHFLELQDDNGDIVGYTAMELFDHLMDQCFKLEDVADQVAALHKILEQEYGPTEAPQVYYKLVQDACNTLEALNETIDEQTLIRHGLNQINQLEGNTGGSKAGGGKGCGRNGGLASPKTTVMAQEHADDGPTTNTVGHVGLI